MIDFDEVFKQAEEERRRKQSVAKCQICFDTGVFQEGGTFSPFLKCECRTKIARQRVKVVG